MKTRASQRHLGFGFVLLLATAVAACDPGPAGLGHEDGTGFGFIQAAFDRDHEAHLVFQDDWNIIERKSPILAGGKLTIDYAPSRLATCRATYNGMPAWGITMYYRVATGGRVFTAGLPQGAGLVRTQIAVPDDAEFIEIWFINTDRAGCVAFDSNLGNNYRFAVTKPAAATDVIFDNTWAETTSGPIVAGGLMRIVYAPERLRACRATYHGGRTWNIMAGWQFAPGGETGTAALYDGDYFAGEAAILRPVVAVPPGTTSVSFWFSNSDRAGCTAWDSDFGANYTFPVRAADAAQPQVGWAGDFNFIRFHRSEERLGDVDPAYYWDSMNGASVSTWVEVQVWVPGVTDLAYADDDARRTAAARAIRAEAVTDALPGAGGDWGTVNLEFVRQQGNNFVYAFRFWQLRFAIYQNPPIPAGLYRYYVRFSTDDGASYYDAGRDGATGRTRRFVVAEREDCALFPDNAPASCPQQLEVGWAGDWGGRFSHACVYRADLPNPVTFTKSALGHDCMILSADVWVEGLTDRDGDPRAIRAEVETDLGFSGGPLATTAIYALRFAERVGNNYRYEWHVSDAVGRADRGDYRFRFRFSADGGRTYYAIGTGAGPGGGDFRTLRIRNDSLDTDAVTYCDGIVMWSGATNVQPFCIDYDPSAQFDATHCEFYVNALGRGQMSHGATWANWLEAYVSVLPTDGYVLNVGLWVRAADEAGQVTETFALGREIEPNYWLTGFTYGSSGAYWAPDSPGRTTLTVEAFAFFVDVERPDGTHVRLWQSNGGANYTIEDTFAIPGYTIGIGVGSIEYADGAVALFAPKRSCQ